MDACACVSRPASIGADVIFDRGDGAAAVRDVDVAKELDVGVLAECGYSGDVGAAWVLATSWTAVRVDDELEEQVRIGGYGVVERSPGGGGRVDVDGEGDIGGEDIGEGEQKKGKDKWEVEELHTEMDGDNVVALIWNTSKRKVD